MPLIITSGVGSGLDQSYATIQDLENLGLPTPGDPAIADSMGITAPFNVSGLTLLVVVSIDGITQPEYTFTFTSNYSDLDSLVAAIQIPGLLAVNNGGRLRLRTIKVGISQNLVVDHLGTANEILGFNKFFDTVVTGRSSVTSEFTEDEKNYALVSASSLADDYLARRYCLPLKHWSFDLKQAVCYIASYILLKRKGFNPEQYDANWVNDYNRAVIWLDDVGNRKLHPAGIFDHKPVPNASNTTDPRGWNTSMGLSLDYCGRRYY